MGTVTFRVTVDARQLMQDMQGYQKQIPYVLARSLTNTALGAQADVRARLPGQFTLRNTFTQRGIRYMAAQKNADVVQAQVYSDTENRQTGAPDYLGRQETGGEKVPVGGRSHIAIPMPALYQLIGGRRAPIPTELRPKNLLSGFVGGRYAAYRNKRNKYTGEMERQLRLQPVKLVRGWEFFQKRARNGALYIFGRQASEHARGIHPMYKLVPEVTIKPRLGMETTVQGYVDAHFQEEWEKMWVQIAAKGIHL